MALNSPTNQVPEAASRCNPTENHRPSRDHGVRAGNRRFLLTIQLIIGLLGGLCLLSCGGAATPTPVPNLPTPTMTVPFEMPVTISIAGRFDDGTLALLDRQITDFESANPEIKVLVAQARADDTPADIYVLDDTVLSASVITGSITSLDEYIRSWPLDMRDFLPASSQASLVDGAIVALPWTADGGMLYYRRDLGPELALQPADTWPLLLQTALDIQTREGLPAGLVWQGAAYESLTCNVLEYVWANGGQVLDQAGRPDFDSPASREALRQMQSAITSGASPPAVTGYNEVESLRVFQSGQAALMRNWSFAWQELNTDPSGMDKEIGVAPLPASCLFGQHLALSSNSRYPDEAFRFMVFLTEHDQQVGLARHTGLVPALETAFDDDALLADQPHLADVHAALLVSRPRPRTAAYEQVSEAIYSEAHAMLNAAQSPEQTAQKIEHRLEAILQEP